MTWQNHTHAHSCAANTLKLPVTHAWWKLDILSLDQQQVDDLAELCHRCPVKPHVKVFDGTTGQASSTGGANGQGFRWQKRWSASIWLYG
jgi:hypothetical protein